MTRSRLPWHGCRPTWPPWGQSREGSSDQPKVLRCYQECSLEISWEVSLVLTLSESVRTQGDIRYDHLITIKSGNRVFPCEFFVNNTGREQASHMSNETVAFTDHDVISPNKVKGSPMLIEMNLSMVQSRGWRRNFVDKWM